MDVITIEGIYNGQEIKNSGVLLLFHFVFVTTGGP